MTTRLVFMKKLKSKFIMKKFILISFLSLLCLPIFAQNEYSLFFEQIEWLNNNPEEFYNEENKWRISELMDFHDYLPEGELLDYRGTKELNPQWENYKFKDYFVFVYSFNQLHYKFKSSSSSKIECCFFALKKLIDSYNLVLSKYPNLKLSSFEEYKLLSDSELKKRLRLLLDK